MTAATAIVTGATGWLGKRLVHALVDGLPDVPALAEPLARPVRCLVFSEELPPELADRVQAVSGDLGDPAALERLFEGANGATVFHCAGVIHPTRGVAQLYEVNERGTRNILEAAKKAGVRRFVHCSSNSPIGTNDRTDETFDESAPYRSYMHYGRSKKLAEDLVNAAGRAGDLETVIIRPPWFYGPGQPPRQTLFFEMIRDGRFPLLGDGEQRRSMAYVDNICQGLLLCERVEAAAGQTYWIADLRPYPMREIIDTVERLLETEFGVTVAHRRMRLPAFVGDVALLFDKMIQGLGMYHQKIHVLSEMNRTIACRIDKAREQLGYEPTVALEEGMRRSIRWVIASGKALAS